MTTETRLLEPLGVADIEEQIYRLLLRRHEATRSDIAQELGRGSAGVSAALQRLTGLGLVGQVNVRPRRYVPVMPDLALESLVQIRQQEVLAVRSAAAGLLAEYRTGRRDDPGELVEILTGEQAVARRFAELQASCTSELLMFDRPPYAAPPDNPDQLPILRRGIRWCTVYAPESLQRPHAQEHVQTLVDAGEQARMLPGLPMKLVIVDRRIALLPLTLGNGLAQSAVIHRSTLLDAMVTLFELFWTRALPIGGGSVDGPAAGPAADRLTGQDRTILTMLVAGAKDETIARELRIGVRTLRRRMQHLLRALDAETRFQAGMQATRRGLI